MADKRRRRRTWSHTAGSYGTTVRVYERGRGGVICAATSDGSGGEIRRSLGHRDKDRARDYADDEARKLRRGVDSLRGGRPTLRRIFRAYLQERTPDKSEAVQQDDRRRAEMWRLLLGPDFDLSKLSRREWDRFVRLRRSGAIDPRGNPEPKEEGRRPVGDRTVERDLTFLGAVCRWAIQCRDADGRLLLERDPTRGLEAPKEKNPKRPVATHDRVDAIREVYHEMKMRVERGGTRETVESYLPEVFEVVVGTGRRISAVCNLRAEDLDLERTPEAPWGGINWPADTDKMGKAWRCPISADVREAVESALRKRQAVGPGPLFPSPTDPRKCVQYVPASRWLREAERKAKLQPQEGSLFHAYRRLWASARKDLPDVDVAKAGGWESLEALKGAYQQPDDATMLRVVTHEAELREVK